MSRKATIIALLLADAVMLAVVNWLFYMSRFAWHWFGVPTFSPHPEALPVVVAFLSSFWLVVFLFFGMYRERYAASRFDELVSLGKVVTIGILILFFLLFIDQFDDYNAKQTIVFYWGAVFGFVAVGRVGVRTVQKALILRGFGLHRTLIVGWSDRVQELYEEVVR